ncbi:TetR/AcrR family transcriptional regulator [Mycolicibacterium thermoresistibile]
MDTAVRLFHSNGYASTSIQAIADEMGILKGSLYYYIRNKEDLLYQVLVDVHDDLGQILDDVRKDTDAAPLDRLSTYVKQQAEYSASNVPRIAIYYRDSEHLSDQHRKTIYNRRRDHQNFVTELLKEAQRLGECPSDEDPKVLANLVFGTFIWTYRWYNPRKYGNPEALGEACARYVIRAVSANG